MEPQFTLPQIEAATKDYYDHASDQELQEHREWAGRAGPNMFVGIPEESKGSLPLV